MKNPITDSLHKKLHDLAEQILILFGNYDMQRMQIHYDANTGNLGSNWNKSAAETQGRNIAHTWSAGSCIIKLSFLGNILKWVCCSSALLFRRKYYVSDACDVHLLKHRSGVLADKENVDANLAILDTNTNKEKSQYKLMNTYFYFVLIHKLFIIHNYKLRRKHLLQKKKKKNFGNKKKGN